MARHGWYHARNPDRYRGPLPTIQWYNLPTDPLSYPGFDSFEQRVEHIRAELLVNYHNELERQTVDQIEAEDLTWLSNRAAEYHQGGYTGVIFDMPDEDEEDEDDSEDFEDTDEFDREHYPFRNALHLPMPSRFNPGPQFRGKDAGGGSSSDSEHSRGRSRDRSRSPSRSRERRGDSPESSRGRRARSDSSEGSRGERARWNSPQAIIGSPPRNPTGQGGNPIGQAGVPTGQGRQISQGFFDLLLNREVEQRMNPFLGKFDISFVGDQHPLHEFQPCRGDLIISHPNSRHIGLPNSIGYIATYLGPQTGSYQYTPRDLVLRIGDFEERPAGRTNPGRLIYRPFTSLELFASNPIGNTVWKFLGHQAELHRAIFHNLPDVSPGKFLKVGSPVLGSSPNFVEALVPRRGDIIIKREAQVANFNHTVNFWYSMVKWHRGRQFPFLRGDMLVRRFVDCDTRYDWWGWAELYEYEGPSVGWVFWGRTQHVYDTLWPACNPYIVMYEYDEGAITDDDIQKANANPRDLVRPAE